MMDVIAALAAGRMMRVENITLQVHTFTWDDRMMAFRCGPTLQLSFSLGSISRRTESGGVTEPDNKLNIS
jgi:hypothetical protein